MTELIPMCHQPMNSVLVRTAEAAEDDARARPNGVVKEKEVRPAVNGATIKGIMKAPPPVSNTMYGNAKYCPDQQQNRWRQR